jgi:hypothetical protein
VANLEEMDRVSLHSCMLKHVGTDIC